MAAIQGYSIHNTGDFIMEKLLVSFDDIVWNYTIDFTHDTVYEQEQTAAEIIADIAQHPFNPIEFSYHEDGICGGKDTDNTDTLSGVSAIEYLREFFSADVFFEILEMAEEETATLTAENRLKDWRNDIMHNC